MQHATLIPEFMHFLEHSPTSWHAVKHLKDKLQEHQFTCLDEGDSWELKPRKAYWVERHGSICAFVLPENKPKSLKLIGAHTDSPGFKLKPQAEYFKENMLMLGLEVYGSPLLTSWLNRDLAIAGRVFFKDGHDRFCHDLVNLEEFRVILPQLSVHLDREVNEKGLVLNKQEHLSALASVSASSDTNPKDLKPLNSLLLRKLNAKTILSYDLFLYPTEKPSRISTGGDLLASYRIDNLSAVHSAVTGLLQAKGPHADTIKMIVFWDHEEIGSHTSQGAGSPFFSDILERICLSLNLGREEVCRLIRHGKALSVDMTHALHPNYMEKSEPRHQVLLGKGVAIKTNAQQRYATDAASAAWLIDLCLREGIAYQHFVTRGDIPAGTTIGPIHAALTGMSTVDIGCPQLSMHSAREIMHVQDHLSMCRLCEAFLR